MPVGFISTNMIIDPKRFSTGTVPPGGWGYGTGYWYGTVLVFT